ncbi:hypothetical protein MUG84_01560 [Paenibacillus sp. KQZ6P-2]|uniref:Uncharacterized protein n=1 Tax=Paenibacillus mangrovi TaxID=2931978 RepID=A0A9X2B3D0_9BACL|nr:hypothetical protein [Paenibacillus mangrovi]MCJ8010427.1 hypothetical protein [Paenibacillus mangrovi]
MLWEDAARQIGLPYRLQITIDNMEMRYETMNSLYVLMDGNIPFFALPFQRVVSTNFGHYSGLIKEGLKEIVDAALSRNSLPPKAAAVVEVFENGEIPELIRINIQKMNITTRKLGEVNSLVFL